MSKAGHIIKLSSNLRPFISRVVRHGRVQLAFAEQIGRPVGACVRQGVHPGMSGGAIKEVVRQCAKPYKKVVLHGTGGAFERESRRVAVLQREGRL